MKRVVTTSLVVSTSAISGAAHHLQAGRADVQENSKRQHQRISVGTSGHHAAALGRCDHRPFRFSTCPSDGPTSANDPSAAPHLQPGTLCLLRSSTVTLSLYLALLGRGERALYKCP